MSNLLPFVVAGLVAGSVYGLTGVGLVLTYKTSGIFNFAQGSVGAAAAYAFYFLHVDHGVPWPIAAILSVCVLGPLMGVALEMLSRRLAQHGTAVKVVGTLGIVLFVQAGAFLWYGAVFRLYPAYLPTRTFRILHVAVGYDQLIVCAISLVSTIALYVFLRYRRTGIAMRAVVDNPELLALTGTSPARVRRLGWVIGTTFASLAGVLLAPSVTLDATTLTLLVVQGFGAAAVGRFSSLPRTYLGGLLIGVAASVSTKYALNVHWLTGLPASLPLGVLFVVLLATRRDRLPARWDSRRRSLPRSWQAPRRFRLVAGMTILVGLLLVPAFAGARQFAFTSCLAYTILFLSLGLLVKTSGQVSLCQLAFAAVSAAAFGHLAAAGLPWGIALVVGALFAVPVGVVVAFSAMRLSGVFLAVATYGFAVLLEQLFYVTDLMFGNESGGGLKVPRPGVRVLATGSGFYYLVLAILLVAVAFVVALQTSRFGRILRALSDSPVALETQGVTVRTTKLILFCICAFLAGIGGALIASLNGTVSGTEFSSFSSLLIFVVLMLVLAIGEPWYALLGAASLTIIPTYLKLGNINNYLSLFFGLSAILLVYRLDNPLRLPLRVRRYLDRDKGRRPPIAVGVPTSTQGRVTSKSDTARIRPPSRSAISGQGIEVRDLAVHYGGHIAVDTLNFTAPLGRVTGLIGPNGAGKTSTFNACSGLLKPTRGEVMLHGEYVSRLGPAARARLGLGRTFQRVELWDSMTVRENLSIASEALMAGASVRSQCVPRPGDRRRTAEAVDDVMGLTGIAPLSDLPVNHLSTGQRRLVELARCLVCSFDILLLDEPSSGLDTNETSRFGEVLSAVSAARGLGILLVEHDMSLVMDICSYLYVLDFGRLVFEGSPADTLASEIVRAVYLGSEFSEPSGALG